MKIPKEIQNSIRKSAKYHAQAREQQSIFETWIVEKFGEDAINDDGIRDTIIDCIEQSFNPEEAIKCLSILLDEYSESE